MQCDGEKCECVKVIEDLENKVEKLREENEKLKSDMRKIGIEANNVLYFADNSDYKSSLYEILWTAMPDKYGKGADELDFIDVTKEAYDSTGVDG